MEGLVQKLEQAVKGEVRFDHTSRILYSTDASMYQIKPLGVVLPKDREDVLAVVQLANEFDISLIPRGGGTGLAGQTVGKGIVLDMSKYMNRILELNAQAGWVRVEPGVVLDELNAFLKPHNLQFAPDVATSSRATVGGMINNNSAGAHSVIYGKTIDHVLELDLILADGSEATFLDMDETEVQQKVRQDTLEGQAYREVIRLARENEAEIERRYPKILRRVGGYNLDAFVKKQAFNLCRMVVGSEGTLATVVAAKVKVVPLPKAKVVCAVQFHSLIESMEATAPILDTGPAAVELIDKMILEQTKGSLALSSQRAWVQGDPEAILVVEYYGDSPAELKGKLDELETLLQQRGFGYACTRAESAEEQDNIWNVRKAGLGLLMGIKGDTKPVAFVEDAAVSPEKLPDYIREFEDIVRAHNTTAGYYAHASVGLLHIRPLINLKQGDEIEKMRSISEQVRDLVIRYGGAMSGEHGDGLVRSCWNEKIFGTRLYNAFREVKRAFDPKGLMNPGKIVDAPLMTENLRYGPDYQSDDIQTHFDFSADGGFHRAIEMCNGVGACRKTLEGTMCPSYMATLEEEHSTRGRANALRAAISGDWEGGLTDKRLFEVLDLCLECKACKAECPSNVDMAKIKYEFLAHYYKAHRRPLRAWMFGNIEWVNRLGCLFAPLSNWIAGSSLTRFFMSVMGMASNRSLPPFARKTFADWFAKRKGKRSNRQVVLFHDTYLNYNYPNIGMAATQLFEAAGYEVILPKKKCCGRPLLSSGFIEQVKNHLAWNVANLFPYVEKGIPIVGFEPSCVSMLCDDYLELTDDPRAKAVAEGVYLFEEFVQKFSETGELEIPFGDLQKDILVHGHCHQKALWGMGPSLATLNLPPGFSAEPIASGCCGMAGSFGYEREHYDISLKVGEDRLLKVVREADSEVEIVAAGLSCRQQIAHGTGRNAKHPAEILCEALMQGES
ncbi:MAG: FAD-binding protein [bacterium]|nr:FAD-binding protein [bacterium]